MVGTCGKTGSNAQAVDAVGLFKLHRVGQRRFAVSDRPGLVIKYKLEDTSGAGTGYHQQDQRFVNPVLPTGAKQ